MQLNRCDWRTRGINYVFNCDECLIRFFITHVRPYKQFLVTKMLRCSKKILQYEVWFVICTDGSGNTYCRTITITCGLTFCVMLNYKLRMRQQMSGSISHGGKCSARYFCAFYFLFLLKLVHRFIKVSLIAKVCVLLATPYLINLPGTKNVCR